ncbi:MAG: S1 RNA-binding domain-containing protein [Candidatus Pacebacteria bacterium]|nr:S1 RNA-binding domain-containing protein [Candidatus Paceibacterota bacterium]
MTVSVKKTDKVSEMDILLSDKEAPKFPNVGDVVKGSVIEVGSNIIYIDLGPIGTGAIYGYGKFDGLTMIKELKSGDSMSATVTDIENEDGYVEMSLKQTSLEMIWKELEKKMEDKEVLVTKILEANKGGLMIKINNVVGFLPASQLSSENYPRVGDGDKNKILSLLMRLVNKDIKVRIIGLDKNEGKLVVSEKATKTEEEKQKVSKLEVGDFIEGEISGIVDFGAFVKFNDNLEGLVHISELAWKLIDDPRKLFNVGQKVKCKIIGIDDSRISLSLKALEKDPWQEVNERYKVGQKVNGEVTKINPFGVFVQLDKDIHGLAHISKLAEESGIELLKVGEIYEFDIISIESSEHRLGLRPRINKEQAREKKEDKNDQETKKENKEDKEAEKVKKELNKKDIKKTKETKISKAKEKTSKKKEKTKK